MKRTILLCGVMLLLSACGGSGGEATFDPASRPIGSPSGSGGSAISFPVEPLDPSSEPDQPDIDADKNFFYFSYDESASTAARDLTFAAIKENRQIPRAWGRAFEYLNAETFPLEAPEALGPFSVSWGLKKYEQGDVPVGIEYDGYMYSLGVNVTGPTLTKEDRPNVVLTLLVDISGSMRSQYADLILEGIVSKMDLARYALGRIPTSLKEGDILNLVVFNTGAQEILQGWAYASDTSVWQNAVDSIQIGGSTNLNAGIELAYKVANENYDLTKSNRVVILTDAFANRGQVNPAVIAENTVINGLEGIHFAGIGIGSGFNDAFLNELTDIGKSVYSAMVSPGDADQIFGDGFMRFVNSAVSNVRFKLTFPQELDQLKSAAEEISTDKNEVNTTNFAYNSSQFFLEHFSSSEDLDLSSVMQLEVEFDGDMGPETVTLESSLESLLSAKDNNIVDAVLVSLLAGLVAGEVSCEHVLASPVVSAMHESDIANRYIDGVQNVCMNK